MASLDLYTPIRAMPDGLSKEGGGGSPHPVPSQSIMGPPSHWPLPSHGTLLFLYKNPRLISHFNSWMIQFKSPTSDGSTPTMPGV